jgi:hypothetical protein
LLEDFIIENYSDGRPSLFASKVRDLQQAPIAGQDMSFGNGYSIEENRADVIHFALSGLMEYNRLFHYTELEERLKNMANLMS